MSRRYKLENLTPISRGRIFISTFEAYEARTIPETELSSTHPFRALWENHWSMVTRPGISDSLIDAFLALSSDDRDWRSLLPVKSIVARRRKIRNFLHQYLPDVILLTGSCDDAGDAALCSFHSRQHPLTNFICIANEYVDLWIDAAQGSENELALRALLHTSIDHETAHWLFTLIKGPTMANSCDPCEIEDEVEHSEHSWHTDGSKGEAGNFVEIRSRGGIFKYSKSKQMAYMETGPSSKVDLPTSYLEVYNQNFRDLNQLDDHSLYFRPTFDPTSKASRRRTKMLLPCFFPITWPFIFPIKPIYSGVPEWPDSESQGLSSDQSSSHARWLSNHPDSSVASSDISDDAQIGHPIISRIRTADAVCIVKVITPVTKS